MSDFVTDWVDRSAYAQALGISLREIDDEGATLALPFDEKNANPGNALHGGVAASLSVTAAHAVARRVLGGDSGPWQTAGFQINYVAAAIGEDIHASARLLRRGKELCFLEVEVATGDGKRISQANVAIRGRQGQPAPELPQAAGDDGAAEPGFMAERVANNPFMAGRGLVIDHMKQGRVRMTMPWREGNGELSGGTHEGAALALLDTAGAMCSWSITGLGKFKASTPSIQARVLAPPPAADLVAYGHIALQDHEFYWNDVEVADAATGALLVQGTVMYRILT